MNDFWKGVITGLVGSSIIFGLIAGFMFKRNKEKELSNYVREYAEKQIEIEALREDYGNRDPDQFLDDIPGVRRATDGATAEFERKRDEILERFRSGFAD